MVNVGILVVPLTGGLSRAVITFITPKAAVSKRFLISSASIFCLAVSLSGASDPDLSSFGCGGAFSGRITRPSSSWNGRGGLEGLTASGGVGGALGSWACFLGRISPVHLAG